VDKEWYVVVSERPESLSVEANREVILRVAHAEPLQYNQFAKQNEYGSLKFISLQTYVVFSYCFRLDRSIVNVHMPMRGFADESSRIIGILMYRVQSSNKVAPIVLQTTTNSRLDIATRSLPGSDPVPVSGENNALQLFQQFQQFQQLSQMMATMKSPMAGSNPVVNLNMMMSTPASPAAPNLKRAAVDSPPATPFKLQKTAEGDVSSGSDRMNELIAAAAEDEQSGDD